VHPDRQPRTPRPLRGRGGECDTLDRLLARARGGCGTAVVVRGEPGIGKSALLDRVAQVAAGTTTVRAVGTESERNLAYATLHQLCARLLDGVEHLPGPQREALEVAFGVRPGLPPDRLLIGLAVLSLVTAKAARSPRGLVCLVDDAQWLDPGSAQALAFVARRLADQPVLLVVATRDGEGVLTGLPELALRGLSDADARHLVGPVLHGVLDERVGSRLLAEAHGNPGELLALARDRRSLVADGPGGSGPSTAEQDLARQIAALPADTRRLVQLAAADPTGDLALLWRAAGLLGLPTDAGAAATDAGLLDLGAGVRFRRPQVRAAAYRSASPHERRRAHRALADATDPRTDADLRVWHRAAATLGPDEDLATELERSAADAHRRGRSAAAFLERAVTLTAEPVRRAARALAAAHAAVRAGAFGVAQELLGIAEATPLGPLHSARAELVRAELAVATRRGPDAPALLLGAARGLERLDVQLARTTYLDAVGAAVLAGHLAGPGAGVRAVAGAGHAMSRAASDAHATGLLLAGMAADQGAGAPAGHQLLRRALAGLGQDLTADEGAHWLGPASVAAVYLWDDDAWDALSRRHVDTLRQAGGLDELPLALTSRIFLLLLTGEQRSAAELVDESRATTATTGAGPVPYGALALAALRGDEDATAREAAHVRRDATARGEGTGLSCADWATAVLCNSRGRYDDALVAAARGVRHLDDGDMAYWCLAELVEAAVRAGSPAVAAGALRQLSEATRAGATDWALGVEARSRAMLHRGGAAERLYREAVRRLARTRLRVELARAQLVYGEWLRREKRRVEARRWLRDAHDLFTETGADGFADRTRRELLATGASVGTRGVRPGRELTVADLTVQEARIAGLARDGLTNPEISVRLFISHRTVEYHLAKVYSKLGISSRGQLASVLPTIVRPVPA